MKGNISTISIKGYLNIISGITVVVVLEGKESEMVFKCG